MIKPPSRKNLLTFGGDPVPDTDFESLFTVFKQTLLRYVTVSVCHLSVTLLHPTKRPELFSFTFYTIE